MSDAAFLKFLASASPHATLEDAWKARDAEIDDLREALANSHNRHEYAAPPGMVFISESAFAELKRYRAAASKG